ncbi:SMC-Scp complex subunit ScpB [Luoshenia tenuis]|jgi:segregation and condensation protein B|uniref:SMC-Scp complex subunit ScpB n=1 Tax=Luoshenia tenuis TaxID=2763654 RepID=UPI003D918D24
MDKIALASLIESILFVSGDPLTRKELAKGLEVSLAQVYDALDALDEKYARPDSGLMLIKFGDKVQLGSKNEHGTVVEKLLFPKRKQSLSQAVMETLSIVAYRQPVTRAEIEQIRGVRCEYAINSLMKKNMIQEVGRKESIGRPMLLGTTDEFLRHFGLERIEDLPGRDEWRLPPEQEQIHLEDTASSEAALDLETEDEDTES